MILSLTILRVCVFFVLLNHSIPLSVLNKIYFCFWGAQAVPIFLLIQVFHAYRICLFIFKYTYYFTSTWLQKAFCLLGRYTYEIYLAQMIVFAFLRYDILGVIDNEVLKIGCYMTITISISIFPVLLFKKYQCVLLKKERA